MWTALFQKHHLTLRIIPWIILIAGIKCVLIEVGWQPMALSGLLTAAVSADVFLLGFLIAGSLPEYKEAERLPGEVAASIDALTDECLILEQTKPDQRASSVCLEQLLSLVAAIKRSFYKEASTGEVMQEIRNLNTSFAAFEPLTQANFIVRLKQEQQNIRRLMLRIRTIREVAFVSTGYAIGEVFTGFVICMLLLTVMSDRFTGLFFTVGLSFLLLYMIGLVKDLDNPFHYHKGASDQDEVDLAPFEAVERKIVSVKPPVPGKPKPAKNRAIRRPKLDDLSQRL